MFDMSNDPEIVRNVERVTNASLRLARTAMCSSDNAPGKITVVLAAMSGPLAAVALMTAKDPDNLTEANFIFATFLARNALKPKDGNNIVLDINPSLWVEAVAEFRKAGYDPASFLAEPMLNAVRTMESDSLIPLETFLNARAAKGDRLN